MEVLDLVPHECGVRVPGIYVVDDDAGRAIAGPFDRTADAVTWIERTLHTQPVAIDGSRRDDAALPSPGNRHTH